jgi:hypothetical protein
MKALKDGDKVALSINTEVTKRIEERQPEH